MFRYQKIEISVEVYTYEEMLIKGSKHESAQIKDGGLYSFEFLGKQVIYAGEGCYEVFTMNGNFVVTPKDVIVKEKTVMQQ